MANDYLSLYDTPEWQALTAANRECNEAEARLTAWMRLPWPRPHLRVVLEPIEAAHARFMEAVDAYSRSQSDAGHASDHGGHVIDQTE